MELPLIVSILLTLVAVFAICMGIPLSMKLDEALPQESMLWMGVTYFALAVWIMLWGCVVAFAWGGMS